MAGKVGAAWPIKGIRFQQRLRSKEKLVYFLDDSENLFPSHGTRLWQKCGH